MAVITGVTRDNANAPLAGVTVNAFRASDNAFIGTAVSDASGVYTVTVPDAGPFYLAAHKDGTPFVSGVSRRDLTPGVAATVQSLWTGVPTTDGAVISVKLNQANTANSTRLAISTSETLSSPVYSSPVAPDATHRVAKHVVTGRAANTEYWYAVEVDGAIDATTKGRFKTLPATSAASFTIALGGCAENTNDTAFDAINALTPKPLFMLTIGDHQYMDIASPSVANYHTAFDNTFARAARGKVAREIPNVYMWDDHDFANDNSSGRTSAGVANSFRANALSFYRARVPAITASANADDTVHHSFVVGRVRFVVSDLRSDRIGSDAGDSATKTTMGATQKAWWKAEITAAKNAGQVVAWVNGTPWAISSTSDSWSSYAIERTELSDHIKAQGMSGKVFILSADMHALAIHEGADYATGGGGVIPIFHAGPLNRASSNKGGPYLYGPYPAAGVAARQYGLMTITDDGTTLAVKWEGFSADGTKRMEHVFTPIGAGAPADTTAPQLSNATGSPTGATTATASVTTDEGNGTLYCLLSTSATATVAAVKAGMSQAVTSTGIKTFNGTGLTASTTYYPHFLHRDAAGNDSPVLTGASFATQADQPAPSTGMQATGGTYSTPGDGYGYWTITSDTNFVVTQAGDAEIFLVGGGGSGASSGTNAGGGGGAGGVLRKTLAIAAGTYAATVGAGGVGATAQGTSGGNTVLGTLGTAIGGGAGAGSASGTAAKVGGSGGGGNSASGFAGNRTGANGTVDQGNNGGDAFLGSTTAERAGGGGGGASAVGGNAALGVGGDGGAGVEFGGKRYAGGGGGASKGATMGAGKDGGGNGASSTAGGAGLPNTGGGGGGTSTDALGGNGGSGIIIIRKAL